MGSVDLVIAIFKAWNKHERKNCSMAIVINGYLTVNKIMTFEIIFFIFFRLAIE